VESTGLGSGALGFSYVINILFTALITKDLLQLARLEGKNQNQGGDLCTFFKSFSLQLHRPSTRLGD
jgi:hypothetical protein